MRVERRAQRDKKERRTQRERELAVRQRALPDKRYGVIVADPEWRFEPYSRETGMDRAADNHYPTSLTEVVASRDVKSIAADDCVLFLWATVPMLLDATRGDGGLGLRIQEPLHLAQGQDRHRLLVRNKHELLLIGTRGSVPAPAMGTQWDSVIEAPRGEHSAKPEIFLRMIEEYFPIASQDRVEPARAGARGMGCVGIGGRDRCLKRYPCKDRCTFLRAFW